MGEKFEQFHDEEPEIPAIPPKIEENPQEEIKREEGKKHIETQLRAIAERQYIPLDIVLSDYASITIKEINKKFQKKFKLGTSQDDLPKVSVLSGERPQYSPPMKTESGEKMSYGKITLGNIEHVLSGDILSEELAHFYRNEFEPEDPKVEMITEEFFGYLGTRLFRELTRKGWFFTDSLAQFEDDEYGKKLPSKKRSLELLKEMKNYIRSEKDVLEVERLKELREDLIIHRRGHEWASKIDVSKIRNWKKLFSMSNAEVRKRFFTDSPDYSGL